MSCHRLSQLLVGALLFMNLCGCGRAGPDVVHVSGTLTRNGKPVPNLEIYFIPTQGRNSVATSDAEGRFKLGYTAEIDGAQVGNHTVFVGYNPPAETGYPPPPDLAAIQAKYGSQEISTIKVEITKAIDDLEIKLD